MSDKPDHSAYFRELIRKLKELRISADSGEIIVPNDDEDVMAFDDLELPFSIDAFKNQKIEKARGLMGYYKQSISKQSDAITMDIISGKINDLDIGSASAVGLYARYLKRISAHSRNLISSIVNPFERIGYAE